MIWTFLVITYGAGALEEFQSVVALPSQEACEEMMSVAVDSLQPKMPDVVVQCVSSGQMSSNIRPKRRPW